MHLIQFSLLSFLLASSISSANLKLCVSIGHFSAMLWALAIICGEVPIMENTRLLEQLCALDTALTC